MESRMLGESGPSVSVVGLGCNNFGGRLDYAGTEAVVHRALDLGVTLFDTADIYGGRGLSEEYLGKALGPRRKDIVLATKFGMAMDEEGKKQGAKKGYVIAAVEDSLRRLGTDVIDLYQLHQPDPDTPIEETLAALTDLVKQGKVKHVGCSNLKSWQVVESLWVSQTKGFVAFTSCQDDYSLLQRRIEPELLPMARHFKLGVLPYFPLASGLLTGKFRRGQTPAAGTRYAGSEALQRENMTDRNWTIVESLDSYAQQHGHSLLELAISWLLAQSPVTSVIAGATKPEQIEANVRAAGWKMNDQDLAAIDAITKG